MRVAPAVPLAAVLAAACGGEDDGPVVYPECPNMGEVVVVLRGCVRENDF